MEIRVLVYPVASDTPQEIEHIVTVTDNITVQELLDRIGSGWADLSDYYPMSGAFTWNEPLLPYLFVEGKVSYNVGFENAKVKDFLYTHNISDHTIRITTGYPWAGGPGVLTLAQLWEDIYPVLEVIAVIATISGFSLKDLFCRLRTHFMKIKQPPQTCFDIVFSRSRWNAFELAELLDIEPARAKELLKLFDYQYDKSQMQYIQGKCTDEIREKLSKVEVRDI